MPPEKELDMETRVLAGFLAAYVVSAVVPGAVTLLADALFPDAAASVATGLLTFGILLILLVGIVYYLRRWLTGPVRSLCAAAEALAHGNLDVKLDAAGSPEIESIARSLDRMKSSLKIAYDWLGPPDLGRYADSRKIAGMGLEEKLLAGMVTFVILNPLAAGIIRVLVGQDTPLAAAASVATSIIMLTLISMYIYGSIIKPVRHLAVMAERVSTGDYSAGIEVTHGGDIGRLERDLKLVSERIQRAMRELDVNGQ